MKGMDQSSCKENQEDEELDEQGRVEGPKI